MKIAVESYDFSVGLPRQLVMAFVSDLHNCDNTPLLDKIDASGADAVLLGGDFIHDQKNYQRSVDFLARCAARRKTFCCIGNHERRYVGDLAALVASTGAVLLDNAAVDYGGLMIGGLSSGYPDADTAAHPSYRTCGIWRLRPTPPPDLAFLARFSACRGYKILLCHHPEYWARYIRPTSVELTLAGHAHGGQWRLFGRGVFAPGQGLFPPYTSGLYEERLLVSRGVGNPHVVPRINNQPMLALLRFS